MRMRDRAATAAAILALCLSLIAATADAQASQQGIASYYKSGKRTANGERFDPMGLTAAHRSLPFGTRVRVTHVNSGRSVVVRINDRGPFVAARIIDLSLGAAEVIGLNRSGVAKVAVEVVALGTGKTQVPAQKTSKPLRRPGVAYNFNRSGRDSSR